MVITKPIKVAVQTNFLGLDKKSLKDKVLVLQINRPLLVSEMRRTANSIKRITKCADVLFMPSHILLKVMTVRQIQITVDKIQARFISEKRRAQK